MKREQQDKKGSLPKKDHLHLVLFFQDERIVLTTGAKRLHKPGRPGALTMLPTDTIQAIFFRYLNPDTLKSGSLEKSPQHGGKLGEGATQPQKLAGSERE